MHGYLCLSLEIQNFDNKKWNRRHYVQILELLMRLIMSVINKR